MANETSLSSRLDPGNRNSLHIQLTDDQKHQLLEFIGRTGDAALEVGVTFKAPIEAGVIAPSTFIVGNAV